MALLGNQRGNKLLIFQHPNGLGVNDITPRMGTNYLLGMWDLEHEPCVWVGGGWGGVDIEDSI